MKHNFNSDIETILCNLSDEVVGNHDSSRTDYETAHDAVIELIGENDWELAEQVFLIETLLAMFGLDKGHYLHHVLEDVRNTSDSSSIVEQLFENALVAYVLQELFEKPVHQLDTVDSTPPTEAILPQEALIETLEIEAIEQQAEGKDPFDAVYDCLDTYWGYLKSMSLTEQAILLQYLIDDFGIESATPVEQLEDSVRESTELVIGSLLWHSLQIHLTNQLRDTE